MRGEQPVLLLEDGCGTLQGTEEEMEAVQVRLLKAPSPAESGDQRPLNPLVLTMLSSPNP